MIALIAGSSVPINSQLKASGHQVLNISLVDNGWRGLENEDI